MQQSIYDLHGYERPLGYQQITNASLQSAVGFTLPTVANGFYVRHAIIQNNTSGTVRWRDDGASPTSSVGMLIPANGQLDYYGEMKAIQFISASGTPILDISYYA